MRKNLSPIWDNVNLCYTNFYDNNGFKENLASIESAYDFNCGNLLIEYYRSMRKTQDEKYGVS